MSKTVGISKKRPRTTPVPKDENSRLEDFQPSKINAEQHGEPNRQNKCVTITASSSGRSMGKVAAPDVFHPVFGRLPDKARGLLSKIRREQHIITVYEAEGWQGANREKLKPRAELQRAEQQIEKSCAAVQELLQTCAAGEGRAIPSDAYDEDGDLDEAHIFCALCEEAESTDDNDIVLCDGPCRRAFHERCCKPPFVAQQLSEDADWLCPACTARDEVLDIINEEFGTAFELDSSVEAVAESLGVRERPSGGVLSPASAGGGSWAALLGGDLVSSDTDDESFRSLEDGQVLAGRGPDATSSSDSPSDSECESTAEEVEGKRQRRAVDYVQLNADMFGDEPELEEEDEGSGDEWS